MSKIPFSTLVSWFAGILVTAVTLTVFAFTNFRTEQKARDAESRIEKRLDRLESKIDYLIGLQSKEE